MKKGPAYLRDRAGRTGRWSLTVYEAKRGRRHFPTKEIWPSSGCKVNANFVIRQTMAFFRGDNYNYLG